MLVMLMRCKLIVLLVAAVAACGNLREPQCPDVKLAAISVQVLDAETGRVLMDQRFRAVAREGGYVDSGSTRHGFVPLALDRAGTYQVHVEAPGYQPWTRQGVNVVRGRCAVLPDIIKARLHRWPDPDTLPEVVSVVSDTAEVLARMPPPPGSPERKRLVNWIFEPAQVAFTLRISLGPEPGRLRVGTTLMNLGAPLNSGGPPRREFRWGRCDFVLWAYRNADLKDKPAWDSRKQGVCADVAIMPELLPGDSVPGRHLDWDGHVLDILGDSLPEGRYHLQAQIALDDDTLWLPAGSIDLRRVPRAQGVPRFGSGRARRVLREPAWRIRSNDPASATARAAPATRSAAPPVQP